MGSRQMTLMRSRTYAHTDIIKHQLKVYSTHVCPSVLEAPCSHPESCTRCAYVGKKCDIPSTPLPWQCLPCESADPCFMAAGSTQNAYTTRPLSPEDETMIQALHDKWGHPSNSKFVQIYRAQNRVGFPTNFLVLLNRFRCKVCALCKGARGYRRSTRVQLHGPHKTPKAVPAPGDIVFCNSNDDSTIGVVTAALLDDLFTVLMPTQHTQTFSLSDLSLAEEIIDTDNGTTDVGGDTEHTPCAVDESSTDAATPPAGDNAARNLSIDFAYALSLGYHKEEYYLLIHADGVEMLWCAPTTSRAQPHELILCNLRVPNKTTTLFLYEQ